MKTELGLDERDPSCFLRTYSVVMVLRKVREALGEGIGLESFLALPLPLGDVSRAGHQRGEGAELGCLQTSRDPTGLRWGTSV